MNRIPFITTFILLSFLSYAQKIENVHAEQKGKQVVITYDINGAQNGQTFDVKLFYSQNVYDWKQAMEGLTGDIGSSVSAGSSKIITWDVLQDLDRIVGTGYMFKVKVISKITNINSDTGTFTDSRDVKTYKWVKIGNQTWMAENLNYRTRIGSWCYNDQSGYCEQYGRLYNWKTAQTACPQGWHLPSLSEWKVLIDFLDGEDYAGAKMKQTGTTNWSRPNDGSTNSSGFTALPGGFRNTLGNFASLDSIAQFWSASKSFLEYSDYCEMGYNYNEVYFSILSKDCGISVRCLKDTIPATWNYGNALHDRRDGQIYNTVKIGTQTWMAENLNYEASKGSWCFKYDKSNCDEFGKLYNWETATIACPQGWHLPSDDEWTKLIDFLGGDSVAGGKMKQSGSLHWMKPNTGATNSSGFTALPGGFSYANGQFDTRPSAIFWSATDSSTDESWFRWLSNNSAVVLRNDRNKNSGLSIRCIKDN